MNKNTAPVTAMGLAMLAAHSMSGKALPVMPTVEEKVATPAVKSAPKRTAAEHATALEKARARYKTKDAREEDARIKHLQAGGL